MVLLTIPAVTDVICIMFHMFSLNTHALFICYIFSNVFCEVYSVIPGSLNQLVIHPATSFVSLQL